MNDGLVGSELLWQGIAHESVALRGATKPAVYHGPLEKSCWQPDPL